MCNTFEQAKIQIGRRTKVLNKTEWILCPVLRLFWWRANTHSTPYCLRNSSVKSVSTCCVSAYIISVFCCQGASFFATVYGCGCRCGSGDSRVSNAEYGRDYVQSGKEERERAWGFLFPPAPHTYTSNLLSGGTKPKEMKEFLGHSDVSITMNIYAHSTREAKRTSARLLDKVVGRE